MLIFNINSFVVLPRGENKLLLSNLLFWLDVTDFDASGKRSGDRYLRLCEAWDIFNKYIAVGKQCQLNWLIYSLNMRFVIDGGGGRRGGEVGGSVSGKNCSQRFLPLHIVHICIGMRSEWEYFYDPQCGQFWRRLIISPTVSNVCCLKC